ncbi:MAG TPA: hypothetical protein VJJ78_02035 [Candidatus Saccharimonadales bacterium]|nr:MAG: hypothetical protein A3D14_01450 [Candidatus Saccharibacteria bacterium RIFCSPHIGHO2_02_FULL_47_12]HLB66353.1 hypothetical protein [Candidatus Saccharimonadales bacterium]
MYLGTKPYGLEDYIRHHGDGSNMYRGETFGQPRTLHNGDVLANGLVVIEKPYEAGNGGVGLNFTDGSRRRVPARIPLLLKGEAYGKLPIDLAVGDIFETGCVVLETPGKLDVDDPRYEQHESEVGITITGGFSGHSIRVPSDLVIALHPEAYPPSSDTAFGAFVLANTLKVNEGTRHNLPKLGQLALEV